MTVTAAYPRLAWEGGTAFEAEAWANVSGPEDIAAHLQARLVGLSGTVYGEVTSTHTLAETEPPGWQRWPGGPCPSTSTASSST